LICAFIAEHRARFGVASICRVLSEHGCRIAPRTFYAWVKRPMSSRALWDIVITEILAGYYEPDDQGRKRPESLYGSVKMWAHLNREGIIVAKCTVERLMRIHGWQGVRRLKRIRTTVSDPAADRAPDLVKRGFRAPAPGRLLVADFTYVRLAGGMFAYTAFVIDAFANRILGWECSTSKQTRFVEAAIRQAAATRIREGRLDAGPIVGMDQFLDEMLVGRGALDPVVLRRRPGNSADAVYQVPLPRSHARRGQRDLQLLRGAPCLLDRACPLADDRREREQRNEIDDEEQLE